MDTYYDEKELTAILRFRTLNITIWGVENETLELIEGKGAFSMSIFTEADLEYDFIYKTRKNLEFIENQCNQDFEDDDDSEPAEVYEVTQLMNSFFGLLTIPGEDYFDRLQKDFKSDAKSREIYARLKYDHSKYYNTFLQRKNNQILYTSEEMTAKTLLRRLRSAVVHASFRPYPEYTTETTLIEGYEFTDHCTIYGHFGSKVIIESNSNTLGAQQYDQNFKIVLTMEEIRTLFYDFCDLILSHYEEDEEQVPEEVTLTEDSAEGDSKEENSTEENSTEENLTEENLTEENSEEDSSEEDSTES